MFVEKIDNFSGHRDCVYTIEASSETHICFSAGADGLVVQWNLAQPDLGRLLARTSRSVYAIRFNSANNQLWVGDNYEGLQVIDLASRKVVKTLKLSNATIFDIQFYGDNAFVAGGDGVITIIDIPSWSFKKHLKVSTTSVRSISINPESKELAAGFSDKHIRIFSLDDFSLKHHLSAHTNSVFSVCYSPDFKMLLSGGRDAHLKVWETGAYSLKKSIPAHLFAINHIAFSPCGTLFATCSMDKSIKIWAFETQQLLKVLDRGRYAGHGTSINRLLWTKHQNQLLAASDDKSISVWKISF